MGLLAQADLGELRSEVAGLDKADVAEALVRLSAMSQMEGRANGDDVVQGLHDACSEMGAECRSEDDDDDDQNDRAQRTLAAFGVRARRRGRTDLPAPRRRTPDLPATRAARVGTIAEGLRIEVDDADAVKVFDASGLLDPGICTVIASEVRAAVEGKRKAVTSSRTPAASSGDEMSLAEGKHILGQIISVDSAREETGETATISLKDAKAEAS